MGLQRKRTMEVEEDKGGGREGREKEETETRRER